ncbi:MAG: DUF134 domain-containing protein [Chlorobiaceae bacterium]|nr:DUF134 domain-containing protein [Chlorobiaceae bacterium]
MKSTRAGRPVNCRSVEGLPKVTCFLPEGIPPSRQQNVVLSVDEVEAIRLADKLGMYQAEAAEKMKVSRQTFGRIVQSARKKVAEALVDGKTICIEGGNIEHECRGLQAEGEKVCVCLWCGYEKPHIDGVPCRTELCPDCRKPLIRKGRFSSVE